MFGLIGLRQHQFRDVARRVPWPRDTRRFMRMMVFFDLPVVTRWNGALYAVPPFSAQRRLRHDPVLGVWPHPQRHRCRTKAYETPAGQPAARRLSARMLTVTEKQFASMKLLVGLPLFQEKGQRQPDGAVLKAFCKNETRAPPGGRGFRGARVQLSGERSYNDRSCSNPGRGGSIARECSYPGERELQRW